MALSRKIHNTLQNSYGLSELVPPHPIIAQFQNRKALYIRFMFGHVSIVFVDVVLLELMC